jgi:hypothetical protein
MPKKRPDDTIDEDADENEGEEEMVLTYEPSDDFSDDIVAELPQPDRARSIKGLPKVTVSSFKIKRIIR